MDGGWFAKTIYLFAHFYRVVVKGDFFRYLFVATEHSVKSIRLQWKQVAKQDDEKMERKKTN